jgi:hypothetical protein
LPPPPPRSNGLLIAALVTAIIVVVGFVGAGAYVVGHRVASTEAGALAATVDAGRASAGRVDKPLVDAGTTPEASVTAGKSASPPAGPKPPAAAKEAVGTCSCLPDEGTVGHGNNQRLASRYPSPMQCDCFTPAGDEVCLKLGADGTCARFTTTSLSGPCAGVFRATGAPAAGQTKDCAFATVVDTYPGPRGRACRGYMHNGKQVAGTTYCFGR